MARKLRKSDGEPRKKSGRYRDRKKPTPDREKRGGGHKHELETSRRGVRHRSCLKCDVMFLSAGAYNRLCDACNDENKGTTKSERSVGGTRRHRVVKSDRSMR